MSVRLLLLVTAPMTASVLLRGQLRALQAAGFEVGLVTGRGPEDQGKELEEAGVRVFRVPMRRRPAPTSDLLALVALRRVMRAFQPHIVSAGTPKAGLLGMMAARLERVPVRVYTLRGLPLETRSGPWRWILVATEKVAARCAHRIVCVSESLRRVVAELGIAGPDKTVVLGPGSSNGVDCERFRPADDAERQSARNALGLPDACRVVGFVGRLVRDKGIEDLAEVFLDGVLPRVPDAWLLLAGDFERGDRVSRARRQLLRSHPRVRVTGFLARPEMAYRAMDVLALPSYREGFPNAVLEAAASGLPTCAYGSTGTVDAVLDGKTGTLAGRGERRALAEGLVRYLEDHELCRGHGEQARVRACSLYSQDLVWGRWVTFYEAQLAGRAMRWS